MSVNPVFINILYFIIKTRHLLDTYIKIEFLQTKKNI